MTDINLLIRAARKAAEERRRIANALLRDEDSQDGYRRSGETDDLAQEFENPFDDKGDW